MKRTVRIILSDAFASVVVAVAAVFACYVVATIGTETVYYLQGAR